jgi:phage shock protein PspC (stress-responsive transcriptional regulator)
MKKSIIVNICGIVFHIDEDAYEILNNYITELNNYFSTRTGGKEIVGDIEARIVELLQPKLSENKQSITIEDIEEIISVLGKPEDIAGSDEEPSNKEHSSKSTATEERANRRLYRDPEGAVIAGIASGMGAYFNVDPLIFRIIFLALIFGGGSGIIIYLILWISVPQAKTVSQRLEMKGENININNIEKKIREEYESVKNNISNINKSNVSGKFYGFIHQLFVAFGKFILIIVTAFKYVFAVFLIGLALTIIISTIAGFFFSDFVFNTGLITNISSLKEFLNFFIIPAHTDILLFFGLAIITIPCVALIYWGLKILIRFKASDKWLSITMAVAWILCLIVFITILLMEVGRYKTESTNREIVSFTQPSINHIYLKLINVENKITEYSDNDFNKCLFGIEQTNSVKGIFAPINIRIEKANGEKPEMEIIRKANSSDYSEATQANKKIKVNYMQNDTILSIDPFFLIENAQQWQFQRCKLILYIPENYDVRFDRNFFNYTYSDIYYDYEGNLDVNKTWKVTNNGLELKK